LGNTKKGIIAFLLGIWKLNFFGGYLMACLVFSNEKARLCRLASPSTWLCSSWQGQL